MQLYLLFQSPCGDLLIGNPLPNQPHGVEGSMVSVPLRGFINRKPLKASIAEAYSEGVSVPLRGFINRKPAT